MKFLFDLFPVIAFFIAFKLPEDSHTGMMYGTAAAMAGSAAQIIYLKLRGRKIEKMYWITLVLIVGLGSLTLLLQNEVFFKWKPTAVNWAFALAFYGSARFTKKSLLQRMMDESIDLPAAIWHRLNIAWVLFFVFSGAANLFVLYNFSTDTWADFKVFGMIGLTIVFAIAQGFYLARHIQEPEAAQTDEEAP
ncbi:MAG: septation protein A [Gammaproteobacteria bacterium]|nr:septation protein A [Gammaproteobacteria bacterium]